MTVRGRQARFSPTSGYPMHQQAMKPQASPKGIWARLLTITTSSLQFVRWFDTLRFMMALDPGVCGSTTLEYSISTRDPLTGHCTHFDSISRPSATELARHQVDRISSNCFQNIHKTNQKAGPFDRFWLSHPREQITEHVRTHCATEPTHTSNLPRELSYITDRQIVR